MDLKELERIANQQLIQFGLSGWTFRLANSKRRLGVCKYRPKRIEIAEYYARNNPPESVLDTLLHEIAHAIAGAGAGHGPAWKAIALRIGASPRACDTSPDTVVQPGDWQVTCPACNRTYHRYKQPKSLAVYRCKCAVRSTLTFEYRGDPARKPSVPSTAAKNANWAAKCAGCATVHFRVRRPSVGVWRCKCRHRCEITWLFRSQSVVRE